MSDTQNLSPDRKGTGLAHIACLALIALVCMVVYCNSLDVPMQFDDIPNIVMNPAVRTHGFFAPWGMPQMAGLEPWLRTAMMSRYIGYLSFHMNYTLNDLDPLGFHLLNVTIHTVNAALLYILTLLLLSLGSRARRYSLPAAIISALAFALHPLNTEAVTYIVQRLASLATMFYLLAVVFYVLSRKCAPGGRAWIYYATALISAALAFKTKETSATLPLSVFLIEVTFFGGMKRSSFFHAAPFGVLSLIIPISLWDAGAGGFMEGLTNITRDQGRMGRFEYLAIQARVVATYLRLIVLPVGQNLDYAYPETPLISAAFFLSLVLHLSLLAAAYMLIRQEATGPARICGFGIAWFYVTLLPESSLIPIIDVIFEHRAYLPLVGICLAGGTAMAWVISEGGRRARALWVMIVMTAALMGTLAYDRNGVWQNEVALWQDIAHKSPGKSRVRMNLGLYYYGMGRRADAMSEYHAPVSMSLRGPQAYNDVGVVYASQGKYDTALEMYDAALSLSPGYPEALINKGVALAALRRLDEAELTLLKANEAMPESADAASNLANVYLVRGNPGMAKSWYERALALKPDHVEARYNLILALIHIGETGQARAALDELRTVAPGLANNLTPMLRIP